MAGFQKKGKVSEEFQQLSIFDDFFRNMKEMGDKLSVEDLNVAIDSLSNAINIAKYKRREKERQEEIARKKQQELLEKQTHDEHVKEITSMDLPLDWSNFYNNDTRASGVHTESIPDALIICLNTLGCVDIEYISSITGQDYKTVICALKGSIYQNPDTWNECFYKGWETADQYLSGNLMRKWKRAKDATKEYNGYFDDNIKAIEKILPPTVATKDIYVTLGSPWVPADVIDDFICHLLGTVNFKGSKEEYDKVFGTKHDEITGTWEIPFKSRYNGLGSVKANSTFGTAKINALHIIEKTLNMKTVVVTDTVRCLTNKTGEKRVINKAETVLAIEKQEKIIKAFQDWVWTDSQRKERLEIIFENQFSCVKSRHFDGSFLTFPTMNKDVNLYPYQKNAVARILFSPNTLLAHDVGSGKTYIMIASGMELRRMGISKKNLYVVPNNLIGQWKKVFEEMYPDANILCVEPKHFTPKKREATLENIKDNDYDGIIMAYSCFEQIPLSKDYYVEELEKQQALVKKAAKIKTKATSGLERKKKALDKALAQLETAINNMYCTVYFDELGINSLFVDEAHNFKNVPVDTKVNQVLGISRKGSKKCQDMMDKVKCVQKQNDGRGVVLATGTPITNSITDIYIMQKYLQSGELALLDLQSFDSWVGMFAERNTEFEIDVDTNSYRLATRFSKFHNLPELTSLLSSIADFHAVDESAGIPEFDGYEDALISKTSEFEKYLQNISSRADSVRKGYVPRKDDNMLKITTDGRKAALDLRLVDGNALFTYQSKVAHCADKVYEIYVKSSAIKGTQLIFCDTSTPKKDFNLYDELSSLLLEKGVPCEHIAYIHSADTEKKRMKLFEDVRKGKIRILIGSTFKLGLGVNVQDKLIALHHLDVPWRPADMVQREGRILRQGNTNEKVHIYRYITEGSFDAYSWQLLETKQRFIVELLSGSLAERSGSDVDDTVLNYAEIKALAIGNPLVKERVEVANELTRYLTLQRKTIEARQKLEKELLEIPARIENQKNAIEKCKEDIQHYSEKRVAYDVIYKKKQYEEHRKHLRGKLADGLAENILVNKERTLMEYQGFKVVLPANMIEEKPFVWLVNKGRYFVELGNNETGDLIRIDNCLENLDKHLVKMETALNELFERQKSIKIELAKNEGYSEEIDDCQEKLRELDKKLGVNK